MRKVFFGFICFLSFSTFGQNLLLDQTLYLSGDTIQGVAYFEEEELVPYAYHLSLFDEKGKAVFNKLTWVPAVAVEFFLPLSNEVVSGKYTLQFSNYQNGMVTHAQQVWVLNTDKPRELNSKTDPNQIGWVTQQGNLLDIELFKSDDSTKYTVQVLEDGIGDQPLVLTSGESVPIETRPEANVRLNIRDERFRVFGIEEELSNTALSIGMEQVDDAMNLSLDFKEPMQQVSLVVMDLSQNPAKNNYPILPNDGKSRCKVVPDHSRLNVGLKTWLRGFQITGEMTDASDGSKRVSQRLILVDPDDEFDLKYTGTNDQGRFGFYNLDFEGTRTLYISPSGSNLSQGKFEFAPPRAYLVSPFPVCPERYSISSEELKEMLRLRMLNRKVATQFLRRRELPQRKPIYSPVPLFEDADNTILLSEYVEMGSMREVIKEIIPYVFLTKKGIGVFSVDQKKSFALKPLILINGVPVPYDEIVLGLEPSELHSVQVLNELSTIAPYGNLAQGGIVSFVMKDRFEFPQELERVEVEGYFTSPAPAKPEKLDGVPYFPSVLHWESSLVLDQAGKGSTSLVLPDYETKVGVEVMGLTTTGRVINTYQVINLSKQPK